MAASTPCCKLLDIKNTKEGGVPSYWGILDVSREMASELDHAGWVDVQQAHDWILDGGELNLRLDTWI